MKINLFQDKEYEQLDWLNKAIEPFIFPANDVMAQLPEDFAMSIDDVRAIYGNSTYSELNAYDAIKHVASQFNLELSEDDSRTIHPYFELILQDGTIIDFESKIMRGGITLHKKKPQLEDEDILESLSAKVGQRLNNIPEYNADISRMNEVMDLLNCVSQRKSRSKYYKISAIAHCFRTIIAEDKWRIRNQALIMNCASWIKDYVETGNLASLSNFTRLKCMTHNGAPIYSMETHK